MCPFFSVSVRHLEGRCELSCSQALLTMAGHRFLPVQNSFECLLQVFSFFLLYTSDCYQSTLLWALQTFSCRCVHACVCVPSFCSAHPPIPTSVAKRVGTSPVLSTCAFCCRICHSQPSHCPSSRCLWQNWQAINKHRTLFTFLKSVRYLYGVVSRDCLRRWMCLPAVGWTVSGTLIDNCFVYNSKVI